MKADLVSQVLNNKCAITMLFPKALNKVTHNMYLLRNEINSINLRYNNPGVLTYRFTVINISITVSVILH